MGEGGGNLGGVNCVGGQRNRQIDTYICIYVYIRVIINIYIYIYTESKQRGRERTHRKTF